MPVVTLLAKSKSKLQTMVDEFGKGCRRKKLKINLEKGTDYQF